MGLHAFYLGAAQGRAHDSGIPRMHADERVSEVSAAPATAARVVSTVVGLWC